MDLNAVTVQPSPVEVKPKRSVAKWIGIVFGVFLVLAIVGGTTAFILTNGPVKVVKSQFEYLKQGDYQSAYSLLSSNAQSKTTLDTFTLIFTEQTEYNLQNDSNATISIPSREIVNNKAQIIGNIKSNGIERPIKYILIKETGTWRIQAINVNP